MVGNRKGGAGQSEKMPKKKSKKKGSKKQRHVEEQETIVTPTDLPQVWLQVDTLAGEIDDVAVSLVWSVQI